MLRDAAGLARCDIGLADGVEDRGLAVVDMAHDGHNRRPWLEGRLVVLVVLDDDIHIGLGNPFRLVPQLEHDKLGRLGIDGLRDGRHDAELHQLLDDIRGALRHPVGQFLDRNVLGNGHIADLFDLGLRLGRAHARLFTLPRPADRCQGALAEAFAAIEGLGDGDLALAALVHVVAADLRFARLVGHFATLGIRSAGTAAGTAGITAGTGSLDIGAPCRGPGGTGPAACLPVLGGTPLGRRLARARLRRGPLRRGARLSCRGRCSGLFAEIAVQPLLEGAGARGALRLGERVGGLGLAGRRGARGRLGRRRGGPSDAAARALADHLDLYIAGLGAGRNAAQPDRRAGIGGGAGSRFGSPEAQCLLLFRFLAH